jgi:prepilin-type N-terminal cleavage/methylation domain-containing protein/prepilin-type processing-associated H-X9-DG protein
MKFLPRSSRLRRGFTLVELLVVIGIIAMLIAILMPMMAKARLASQSVVCRANLKQISVALYSYGIDNKCLPGSYWNGPQNLDWCGRNNAIYLANPPAYSNPIRSSVLWPYLKTDKILVCPTAGIPNHFYDYTMVMRMAGAKPSLSHRVSYPIHPEQGASSPRKYFDQAPVLVEESQWFYNVMYDDGSWSNLDQFSTRHGYDGNAGCNVAYLDGSVGFFSAPHGPLPGTQEPQDMCANDLRLEVTPAVYYSLGGSTSTAFGWVNAPN